MRYQLPSNVAREILAVIFRLGIYFGVLVCAIALMVEFVPVAAGVAGTDAPSSQWIKVERPHAAFAVSFPDIQDKHPTEIVLRDPVGGGRREQIVFEHQGRSALIEVYRPGRERDVLNDTKALIIEHLNPFGSVETIAAAPAIDSRFGPISLYDVTLIQGERRRGCLGFARNVAQPRLQISGWFCNPDPGMVARPRVACALDRLTLLSAGADPNIARFFTQAELRARACTYKHARSRVNLAAADWIDTRRAPQLRGIVRR